MSNISKAFRKKNAFVGYLTAGAASAKDFLDLEKMGVNVLEVGIPFSDPVADGPVIQKAMQKALDKGTTPDDVLNIVREIREKSEIAIVLFTYYNPIQKDLKGFLTKAKQAGADGILVVDLPVEEAYEYEALLSELKLDPIFVIAPSTPIKRMKEIAKKAKGFLYYACRKGTTGARSGLPSDLLEKIEEIREVSNLPIAVGFGISSREIANEILKIADGFVVGSHLVEGKKL